jgi:hypothetical protein
MIGDSSSSEKVIEIYSNEIVIFEYDQHTYIGDKAHGEECFSLAGRCVFDHDAGDIIYYDGEEQYKYVYRHECHVKQAARNKQVKPAEPERK